MFSVLLSRPALRHAAVMVTIAVHFLFAFVLAPPLDFRLIDSNGLPIHVQAASIGIVLSEASFLAAIAALGTGSSVRRVALATVVVGGVAVAAACGTRLTDKSGTVWPDNLLGCMIFLYSQYVVTFLMLYTVRRSFGWRISTDQLEDGHGNDGISSTFALLLLVTACALLLAGGRFSVQGAPNLSFTVVRAVLHKSPEIVFAGALVGAFALPGALFGAALLGDKNRLEFTIVATVILIYKILIATQLDRGNGPRFATRFCLPFVVSFYASSVITLYAVRMLGYRLLMSKY